MWNAILPIDHPLREQCAKHANVVNAQTEKFKDGEWNVKIDREQINPLADSVIFYHARYDNIFALFLLSDAVKRACTGKIYIVAPYLPYSRQDRVTEPGYGISAKVVANCIGKADMIWTVDLHSRQIQGFYDSPLVDISPAPVLADDIAKNYDINNVVIIAPDNGGITRARAVSTLIGSPIAIINKYRERAGVSKALDIIGDVANKTCIIIDDIIDGGGTLMNAAAILKDTGKAAYVAAYATHPVLSGNPAERIKQSAIDSLVVTDTLSCTCDIRVLSVSDLIMRHVLTYTER